MNSTLYLSISALLYTIVIFILFTFKKKLDTAENRIFKRIIIITIISLITELSILFFTLKNLTILIPMILKFFNICIVSWVFIFGTYSFVITYKEKNVDYRKKYKVLYTIYKLLHLVAALAILILPVNLSTEANKFYSYGPSVNIVYLTCGLLILIMFIFLLRNFKNLKDKGYYPIIIFILLMGVVAIIQNTYPEVLLTNALFGFIVIILYHTIENPDLKMLHELELAKDIAEKSNRAKSDFLSSMSHEIRTPLNAIIGLSELNKDAESLEESKENSKDIIGAAHVLHDIVGNVLDMSKVECGEVEIKEKEYNPKLMFENAIKLVEYRFQEKGIPLNTYLAPDLPKKLLGDKASLTKVIINLLTNAVKYTSKGHVNLTVNSVNKNNISRIIIAVEDTGRGIKPEQIDKLFVRFSRLDEDRNTTTEGTGLGLAITKHILDLMGGKIFVQSIFGKGSKFTVALDQKIIEDNKEVQKEHIQTDNNILNLSGKKIFLIDDNALNLKVAQRLLQKYNSEIETVNSGEECLSKIKKGNKYDLLLMDEMMPNMSGTETMHTLKDKGYQVPIVVLTADVEANSKEKYLSTGYDDYLGKPIEIKELERVLKKYLL